MKRDKDWHCDETHMWVRLRSRLEPQTLRAGEVATLTSNLKNVSVHFPAIWVRMHHEVDSDSRVGVGDTLEAAEANHEFHTDLVRLGQRAPKEYVHRVFRRTAGHISKGEVRTTTVVGWEDDETERCDGPEACNTCHAPD